MPGFRRLAVAALAALGGASAADVCPGVLDCLNTFTDAKASTPDEVCSTLAKHRSCMIQSVSDCNDEDARSETIKSLENTVSIECGTTNLASECGNACEPVDRNQATVGSAGSDSKAASDSQSKEKAICDALADECGGTWEEFSNGTGMCVYHFDSKEQQEKCEGYMKLFDHFAVLAALGTAGVAMLFGCCGLCCCCACLGLIAWCLCGKKGKKKRTRGVAQSYDDEYGSSEEDYSDDEMPLRGGSAWMETGCPQGCSWRDYCQSEKPYSKGGQLSGRWGECLAWAAVYETRNPNFLQEPRFRNEGVVRAVIQELPRNMQTPSEALDDACKRAILANQPCPLIGYAYQS